MDKSLNKLNAIYRGIKQGNKQSNESMDEIKGLLESIAKSQQTLVELAQKNNKV